jgi:NhaP-type Na+/H+ or K+/H+ antiporter
MTENEQIKTVDNTFMSSKFGKVVMTILAVFLVFAGPTYVVYGLAEIIKLNLAASFLFGFVLFIVGLVLMRYLVKNKVIS